MNSPQARQVAVCPEHGEYELDAPDSPCPACEDGLRYVCVVRGADGNIESVLEAEEPLTDEDWRAFVERVRELHAGTLADLRLLRHLSSDEDALDGLGEAAAASRKGFPERLIYEAASQGDTIRARQFVVAASAYQEAACVLII